MRSQRRLLLYIPPVLVLLAVVGLMLFIDAPKDELAVDQDLCPSGADELSGRAVFLLDLRKPLDFEHASLPGALLREVAMELDVNAELQVFALAGTAAAPRISLDHTCKPYDDAELAGGGTAQRRDCDDLSAALSPSIRDKASRFCAWRDALRSRLDGLVIRQSDAPVANAYLVEAIEDTILEFAEFSGRRSLYIFSDMMQHATWYSQPEGGVEYGDSGDARGSQISYFPLPRAVDDLRVKIFYVPRRGVTEDPQIKAEHKDFWRDYFADFSGTDIEFEDQPAMVAYEAESLASEPTEIELAAREREQLRLEREQIELALAEVGKERTALEAARKLAAEEQQARAAREAELKQQQELARAGEAERESERQRLEAQRLRLEAERSEIERRAAEALAERQAQDAVPRESIAESGRFGAASSEPPAIVPPAVQSDAREEARIAPERSADQPQTGITLCEVQLKPEFATGPDFYPGGERVNYGGAVITVRYTLNEQGETVDDETAVVGDSSNATRRRFLDVLARDTVELVKGWEFAFTQGVACAKPQVRTAVFRYRSKCVGAPVPKCRTIQSDVMLLTGN